MFSSLAEIKRDCPLSEPSGNELNYLLGFKALSERNSTSSQCFKFTLAEMHTDVTAHRPNCRKRWKQQCTLTRVLQEEVVVASGLLPSFSHTPAFWHYWGHMANQVRQFFIHSFGGVKTEKISFPVGLALKA